MTPVFQHHLYRATRIILVGAAYLIAGKLGLMLASVHPSATVVWAPTGIALAAFLLCDRYIWIGIFVGAFIVNVTTEGSLLTTLAIASGNTLEGLVGATLIKRFAGWPDTFNRIRHVFSFVLLAALASPVISATMGVTALSISGFAPWQDYGKIWFNWWVGDAAGAIVVTPLLILWFRRKFSSISVQRIGEGVGLFCFAVASLFIAFGEVLFTEPRRLPIAYVSIPSVIWAAARFGPRITITLVSAISAVAIAVTLQGIGPFAMLSPGDALLLLQLFIAVIAITGLTLAAAIVERDLSAKADRESQERFYGIFKASKDGIIFTSLNGRILEVNDAFAQMTGYSKGELTAGMRYQHLTPAEYHAQEEEKIAELQRTGKSTEFEKEYIQKDGSRIFALTTVFFVRGPKGNPIGMAAIVKDITQRKREEMAKSQFVLLASHQLRTPLSAIRWGISSVKETLGNQLKPSERSVLESAQAAVTMMSQTMKTLLRLSQIEARKLQSFLSDVSLPSFLQTSAGDFEQRPYGKKQSVIWSCPPDCHVLTDPNFLKQILDNLLDNASKYSDEESTIEIRAERHDDTVSLHVHDTGIGIPANEQPQIFSLFYRGKNAQNREEEGMGLGLYIVASLIRLMGGKISCSSIEGQGTTFSFDLPAIDSESQEGHSVSHQTRAEHEFATTHAEYSHR